MQVREPHAGNNGERKRPKFFTWPETTAQDVEVQPKLLSSESWCGLESNPELIGPIIFGQRCICTTPVFSSQSQTSIGRRQAPAVDGVTFFHQEQNPARFVAKMLQSRCLTDI
jgi:hypothetical protein